MKSGEGRFRDIKIIRENDGVCALITERIDTGHISFTIFKEYSVSGETKRTNFLGKRHIVSVRKLLNKLADEVEVIEDHARAERRAL